MILPVMKAMHNLTIKGLLVVKIRTQLAQRLGLQLLLSFTALATLATEHPADELVLQPGSVAIPVAIPMERPAQILSDDGLKTVEQRPLIYKSVDGEGHVSFGDQPASNAVQLETLQRPSYQENTDPEALQTRINQMAATTQRLQEDRKRRTQLRRPDVVAQNSPVQAPVIVVENRVYRPPRYPYLLKPRLYKPYRYKPYRYKPSPYKPYHYKGERTTVSRHAGSSLGLHLGGGRSRFHYGLAYGHQQGQQNVRRIETPYHSMNSNTRSSKLLKRHRK